MFRLLETVLTNWSVGNILRWSCNIFERKGEKIQ